MIVGVLTVIRQITEWVRDSKDKSDGQSPVQI